MKIPRRTHYTVLQKYIEHYGHLINNPDQLRYALLDLNEIMDFALYKADILIDADAAKRISEVGLQWLSYAQLHPESPKDFATIAQEKLENPVH